MKKYIKYISPFVFLITCILLISFRQVPSGKLWKEYNVIYVPVASDDSKIIAALNQCEIKDVVCLSGQFLPLSLNENLIEVSMLRLNAGSKDYEYSSRRKAFFFDKASLYRLYYIPSEYKSKLETAVKEIERYGIPCGTDTSASYPWLLPVICLLLAIMLLLFVKNKIVFAAASILPLIFLFSNPFYPAASAICLILLVCFFISNIWNRKGAVKKLTSLYFIPGMLAISIVCAFSASVISGFCFIITLTGSAASLLTVKYFEEYFRNKKSFVPVLIRPAKRISIFAGKSFITLSVTTLAAVFVIALFFLSSTDSIRSKSSKLLLPAASSIKNENLPQFEDYYRWRWNVSTAPYKSLNSYSENPDYLEFSTFTENESTGIISQNTITMQYNDAFKTEVFEEIDSLNFNSLEKVMKSEGRDFTAGYSAISPNQINLFGIIMMFICLFILLFIYFSIIIRKGINK